MKKLFFALTLLISPVAFSDEVFETISISSRGTAAATVMFSASRVGRNCITELSCSGDSFVPAGITLSALDGGTTIYSVSFTTGVLVESWQFENPLCGSWGTTTYFTTNTGNFRLNATGHAKPR